MNITPKISILIANYNNGHFFEDCCRSLLAQTEPDWEAVIIDDASTDNSVAVISKLIVGDSRFRFYQNDENIGYQRTLIKGISLISSEIFGRVDPDDALAPQAVELSVLAHQENPDVGLVYSNFIFCNEKLEKLKVHKGKQIVEQNLAFFNFNAEISHFATFKKTIYKETEGIDTSNRKAEDQDIYMKMCEIAPVKYIDEDLYLYRIHDGGISTNSNSEKAYCWHWVAIIKAAERRNINIEDLFIEKLVRREVYDTEKEEHKNLRTLLKKSRWLKLGAKLGLFKLYKYL